MKMRLNRRLLDRERPPYALPTVFTVGTLFLGYYCLMKTVQAISLPADSAAQAARLYDHAALAIGLAVFTDGMDGRIARATGAVSDFGREIDSLADVITFGVAPAILAVAWGVRPAELRPDLWLANVLPGLGYLVAFLYLTCGAARLARFNVQKNPLPRNPGRPGRRYFVGMPIPAGAAMIAAVIHACGGEPLQRWWPSGILWLLLIGVLSYFMVSRWRWSSFKDVNFMRAPVVGVIFLATVIFLIWNFSQPVLLVMASVFVLTGVYSQLTWLFRRNRTQPAQEQPSEEETSAPLS